MSNSRQAMYVESCRELDAVRREHPGIPVCRTCRNEMLGRARERGDEQILVAARTVAGAEARAIQAYDLMRQDEARSEAIEQASIDRQVRPWFAVAGGVGMVVAFLTGHPRVAMAILFGLVLIELTRNADRWPLPEDRRRA